MFRIVRHLLKVRYIVLGSAVGGGIHAKSKYEDWKDSLPDFSWIKDLGPDAKDLDSLGSNFVRLKEKYGSELDGWLNRFSSTTAEKLDLLNQWIEEARIERQKQIESDGMLYCF